MGSGKYQLPCTKPVLAEHSNWAKIAVRYSVTMALCREHSSESLHQSLMEEGLVEGHSFVFIKYSPTFSTICIKCLWQGLWTDLINLTSIAGEGNGTPLQYSCLENPIDGGAWWASVHGVAKSRTQLSDFTFTFHLHALEKEMATHSSVLAWRIPGTGEPGELPSMGSHRVGHDWSDLAAAAAMLPFGTQKV